MWGTDGGPEGRVHRQWWSPLSNKTNQHDPRSPKQARYLLLPRTACPNSVCRAPHRCPGPQPPGASLSWNALSVAHRPLRSPTPTWPKSHFRGGQEMNSGALGVSLHRPATRVLLPHCQKWTGWCESRGVGQPPCRKLRLAGRPVASCPHGAAVLHPAC